MFYIHAYHIAKLNKKTTIKHTYCARMRQILNLLKPGSIYETKFFV